MFENKRYRKPKIETIKNGQSRDTSKIGHTRHRTKTHITQKYNTAQKTKKMSKMDHQTKKMGVNPGAPEG